jgi:hypothetical protein
MPAFRDPDENLVVQFRHLPMENATRTLKEGRPIFDDVEMCEIRVPGSRDTKYFPSTTFSHWETDPLTGAQRKITYAERFPRQYQQFKARAAQTVTGTPLEFALFLTDGRRAELRAQNVYTIEALATIEGNELKNLGPGGREMKNRAMKFIEDAKARAPDSEMMAQLEAMRARNAVLEEDNKLLQSRVAGNDAAFDDMSDMTDEQLRDYIVSATGRELHGNLPRKTLQRMAAEATPKRVA